MRECVAGRELKESKPGSWPEFAQPCERTADEYLYVDTSGAAELPSICAHHREILQRIGVIPTTPMSHKED